MAEVLTRRWGLGVTFAALLTTIAADAEPAAAQDGVLAARVAAEVDAARGGTWSATTATEWTAARALFGRLLAGEELASLATDLAALDLEALALDVDGDEILIVREMADARRGRGMFLFRPDSASSVLLQAPHSRSDRGTGRIAAAWAAQRSIRAAAWNTVHRNAVPQPRGASDLARVDTSYFTALTAAAMDMVAEPVVVQVHGFAADRRDTRAGRGAEAIVSSGTVDVTAPALALAACLTPELDPVRIYGLDVDELGGTLNPVGRRMREAGFPGFVHLELSAEVRTRLLDAPEIAGAIGACIVEPYR